MVWVLSGIIVPVENVTRSQQDSLFFAPAVVTGSRSAMDAISAANSGLAVQRVAQSQSGSSSSDATGEREYRAIVECGVFDNGKFVQAD
jgi:hypothetical protein